MDAGVWTTEEKDAVNHKYVESYLSKPYLLVELDVLQDFDGLVVIAQQGVKPQEPHQAEVAQHLVEGVTTIFSSHTLRVS